MKQEMPPNQIERIALHYGARFTPPVFTEEEAMRYAGRIDPKRDLLSIKNEILRRTAQLVLETIKQGDNAIDLGCGEGQWSRLFARQGARSIGIDSNPFNIKIAEGRKTNDELKYLCNSIENMSNEYDGSFDLAVASYLFNYLTKLSEAFQACHRLLKQDGRLIIVTKIFHDINEELEKIKGLFLPVVSSNKFTIYTSLYSNDDYLSYASSSGFDIDDEFEFEKSTEFSNQNLTLSGIKSSDKIYVFRKIGSD